MTVLTWEALTGWAVKSHGVLSMGVPKKLLLKNQSYHYTQYRGQLSIACRGHRDANSGSKVLLDSTRYLIITTAPVYIFQFFIIQFDKLAGSSNFFTPRVPK